VKICHFIASSLFGGAEKVVLNLCNEMSKTHDVYLITFDTRENLQNLSPSVKCHSLKEFKRYNLFEIQKLLQLIHTIQPDIINTHGAKASRIVYTIKSFLPCTFVGTKHNARKGKIFNKMDYVISVSKEAEKTVKAKYTKVIYNGIQPLEMSKKEETKGFTLLAVGRLDKIKGFDVLIKACAKLDFPFTLSIIGEGGERENLESLIDTLSLQKKVHLLGFRKDIPSRMSQSDMTIMSSHSEGFSLVMVESFFYANIFISTKVSGANEILTDMFLVESDEIAIKIKDIYTHTQKYTKMFDSLKSNKQDMFLLKNVSNSYIDYYQVILEKSL